MRSRTALLLSLLLLATACSETQSVPVLIQEARSGDERASWRLVQAMGSEDRETALAAYKGVISLGNGMEPSLIRGLRSSDDNVVEASAAALGNLGSTACLDDLVGILSGSGKGRYAAAWALGEIGDLSAVPTLVKALDAADPLLRKSAVRALVKLGPEASGQVADHLGQTADVDSQRAAIRVVGELRAEAAVETLVALDGPNRDAAAWALGRIGSERGLQTLLGALEDPAWQVRREAAQALGDLEDARAVGPLEAALEDPVTVVREWAARSLETITGQQVLYRGEDGVMVPPYNLYR